MKRSFIIILFILAAALVVSLAACSDISTETDTGGATDASVTDAVPTATERQEDTETSESGQTETEAETPRSGDGYPEGYMLSPAPWDDPYIRSLSFFGDSTTYHLKARGEIAADKIIHGKAYTVSLIYLSDLRIRTASETDDDYKTVSNYFLTLGLGGGVTYVQSGKLSKDDFMSLYDKLITRIREASPETTVMLQSIFPVLENNHVGADNRAINEVNSWIREYAEKNGLYYFNTHSVLTDENGALKQEYAVKKDGSGNVDGYHITAEGYNAILNYIVAYKYEVQN